MYYDTSSLTPLRIAAAQRQADLERSLRPDPFAPAASVAMAAAPVDTRAAGEPIAAAAAAATVAAASGVQAVAAVTDDCGECRTAEQAA